MCPSGRGSESGAAPRFGSPRASAVAARMQEVGLLVAAQGQQVRPARACRETPKSAVGTAASRPGGTNWQMHMPGGMSVGNSASTVTIVRNMRN